MTMAGLLCGIPLRNYLIVNLCFVAILSLVGCVLASIEINPISLTISLLIFLFVALGIYGSIIKQAKYVYPYMCLSFMSIFGAILYGIITTSTVVPFINDSMIEVILGQDITKSLIIINVVCIVVALFSGISWLITHRFYIQLVKQQIGDKENRFLSKVHYSTIHNSHKF